MSNRFNKNKSKKTLHIFEGFINEISETQVIAKNGKAPLERATLTFSTLDDQLMFLELRGKILERVHSIGLGPSDRVKVGLIFAGSKRGENTFNNIFCNSIDYVG